MTKNLEGLSDEQLALKLEKSKLREEMLLYVLDNNPSTSKFFDYIGNRIIELYGCDQVIFFDKSGEKYIINTPGTETVPESLCSQCAFERCRGKEEFSNDGTIVMEDCSKGYMGENVHPKCPVKSSIIQQVFADSELVGWLNVNYLKKLRKFSDRDIEIMKTISAYFGLLVERIDAKKAEQDRIKKELSESKYRRDREIIEVLASEYSSVYYIELTTDGLTPYTMNAETKSEFGQIFNSGISYSEAFKMYVDKLIYSGDKQMMLRAGSIENIKKELRAKKTFITRYRSSNGKYSEMKFVKVGGEYDAPMAVALGFAEKDKEIREALRIEEEKRRNTEIIEILASEYSSVYYIDLATDGLNPYTMNAEIESEFGQIFNSGITYSEAFRLYVNRLIFPEDKPMMLKAGSIDNIKKELRNKKTFITQYRSSDGKYSEMKFVKVGGEYDEPKAVALGFAEKDAQIRRVQEI